jgi:hypothetical protein
MQEGVYMMLLQRVSMPAGLCNVHLLHVPRCESIVTHCLVIGYALQGVTGGAHYEHIMKSAQSR